MIQKIEKLKFVETSFKHLQNEKRGCIVSSSVLRENIEFTAFPCIEYEILLTVKYRKSNFARYRTQNSDDFSVDSTIEIKLTGSIDSCINPGIV